ncbi:MAG: hypothetical protein AB4040_10810 [Synechococcus sp.]
MINRQWMRCTIAGCAMLAIATGLASYAPVAWAQEPPSPARNQADSNSNRATNREGGERSQQRSSLSSALNTLRQKLERQEPPLGSRGAQCAYSPGLVGENDTIWSDRPIFLWRAAGQTLSLYDYESEVLLWQRDVEAGTHSTLYDGEPLTPGGLYRWELTHPEASDFNATFAVMDIATRETLNAELGQAQANWSDAGLTGAELVVARATFFGDRRLWSDALQELHSARDFAEVEEMVTDMSIYLCGAFESDLQAAAE